MPHALREPAPPDYYELLQVSPRADRDTVERVFRHLAKRYHPDNPDSGDPARFRALVEAFRTLSDPERRARYDTRYEETRQRHWKVFDPQTAASDAATDRALQAALLGALYVARRNDCDHPGMGDAELERLLGCPPEHLRFHLWYVRENGWVQRLDTGLLAITAAGVDRVMEAGGPLRAHGRLLAHGDQAA